MVYKILLSIMLVMPFGKIKADGDKHTITHFERFTWDKISTEGLDCCLCLNKKNTILSFCMTVQSDYKEVWIGGDDTYILDLDHGTRYAARKALNDAKLNCWNIIQNQKGTSVRFEIEFPPLPRSVKHIRIYGIPEAKTIKDKEFKIEEIRQTYPNLAPQVRDYNLMGAPVGPYVAKGPQIASPILRESGKEYNVSDSTSYPIFTSQFNVHPMDSAVYKKSKYAMWCTKDTTYITYIVELKHSKEPFYISNKKALEGYYDRTDYKLLSSNYPIGKVFYMEGIPGDLFVILLKYEPIQSCYSLVNIFTTAKEDLSDSDPTQWVGRLLDNRKYIKPFKGKIKR